MAGLPWIKVWTAVARHPKVQRLERELGISDGLGIVIRLWAWTADYFPAGEVPEAHANAMEEAATGTFDVTRDGNATVTNACVTCGLLDRIPGGFRVHDWHDMQTIHVEAEEKRKAQARERQARYRAKHNASPNPLRDGDSVTEKEKEKEIKKEIRAEQQSAATLAKNGAGDDQQARPPLVVEDHNPGAPAGRWPLLFAFRRQLADRLANTSPRSWTFPGDPAESDRYEARLGALTVPVAVEHCATRHLDRGKGRVSSLTYFLRMLDDDAGTRAPKSQATAPAAPHAAFEKGESPW